MEERKKKNITEKIRENPWIITTLVLGILIAFILLNNSGVTGKTISANKAGKIIVQYLNTITDSKVKLADVENNGRNMYKVTIEYKNDTFPIYITKDGLYYTPMLSPIILKENQAEETQTQEIPKSDKPKVELFVMSYCPYGTQAEKGIIPVVETLGDSIDFYVRFVYYAMHPSYGEVEENLRQYCIQEEQKDKFLDYLKCFLKDGDGETCLDEVKIDKTKLSSCTSRIDEQFDVMKNLNDKSLWLNGRYPLFNVNRDLNKKYNVEGSPTLVINGEKVNSGRSPADYLNVICQAFSDEKVPDACSEKLSTSAYSPGFGYSESESASSGAQCG